MPENAKPYTINSKTSWATHKEVRRPTHNDVQYTHEIISNNPPLRFWERARRARKRIKHIKGPSSLTMACDKRHVAKLPIIKITKFTALEPLGNSCQLMINILREHSYIPS